jgi:hypothetical protein
VSGPVAPQSLIITASHESVRVGCIEHVVAMVLALASVPPPAR